MKKFFAGGAYRMAGGTLLGLLLAGGNAWALPNAPEVIPAQGGPIRITPIYHASMQIEYGDVVIDVDPFGAGDYSRAKKPNIIVITDVHPDHCDENAIKGLLGARSYCTILCPKTVASQLKHLEVDIDGLVDVEALGTNASIEGEYNGVDVNVSTVPMYNLVRGPEPGEKFHPKGRGNGYVLTLGGKRIYIAGDTEVTPEMKALENIDVAFIPMNLPYTMTPQEAAAGVKAFKPKVVYPYHYRYPFDKTNTNPQAFAAALKGTGIEVRVRDWYAHPALRQTG